ncbi:putative TOS1-like glycosyl hydrolase-domain-containing protein [Cladorrhinum sp. PSN259]|nr:putative TOS1-like glycosyl hydrolase-domain-containing protein [Cladorrhinum sp. PSN259]
MVAIVTAVVAILGCSATGATAGRTRRDSTAQNSDSTCDVEDGNRYCASVSHVSYPLDVNRVGFYQEVVNMNLDTGTCDFKEKHYSGSLAPFNEPMSVHFRGPIRLKQFAVYVPMGEGLGEQKRKAFKKVDIDTSLIKKANFLGKAGSTKKLSSQFSKAKDTKGLAKKDLDYAQLDLDKLEQTTQSVVWVTETATVWTTVFEHVGGNRKLQTDGAACGAASQLPASIKSQAPMVPVNPDIYPPFQGHSAVTTSTVSSEISTGVVVAVPSTVSSVLVSTSVTSLAISPSTSSSGETSTTNPAVSAPVGPSTVDSNTKSILIPTMQSSVASSVITSSLGSAVGIPIGQTPSSPSILSVSSTSSAASVPSSSSPPAAREDFHRVAYYHAETQQAGGLIFLGNKGDGVNSGQYNPHFGASLAFINPNASLAVNESKILDNVLIPSLTEFSIFSSVPCNKSDCGYTRPGDNIPAFHGFHGSTRIFLFEFSMPHDTSASPNKSHPQWDTPAIWLLNAKIPLTQQYGDCSCWEGGKGCGEIDIFETLSTGEAKAVTSLKAGGDTDGNQGKADWLDRPVNDKTGVKLAVGLDGAGSMLWISVLGQGNDGKDMFEGEMTLAEVEAMKDGK